MATETLTTPRGAELMIFDTIEEMAAAFADGVRALAARRQAEAPFFSIALTGGNTPRPLYARLAEPAQPAVVDWSRVKVFFGDERTVAPDHPDSNYGMARAAWLGQGAVPSANIHRMEGEADPAAAAERYAAMLRRELPEGDAGLPRIDLVLLGMGDDGHVASLFPGTDALGEDSALAVANRVSQHNTTRLTLTFPVLNAAGAVWMLVAGAGKAGRVAEALGYRDGGDALPVARVRPGGQPPLWWLDRAAAAQIPRQ